MPTPGPAQFPYQRIVSELREQIESGSLTGRLPSRMKLAEQYEVAPMTAQRALDTLRAEGLVYSVPGLGVFVTE